MLSSTIILLLSISSALCLPSFKRQTKKLQFLGVNESGAQFGENNLPGVLGKDYIWPDLTTVPTFVDQGFNIFRVNFQMERLSPSGLTGTFDATYLGDLKRTCLGILDAGAYCMIDPHNFGRFYGQIITSTSDFGSWWGRLAAEFGSNDKVIFDINNEFHDEPGQLVADLNQAAINAIRAAGATSQYITPEGNAYSGAWTWTTAQGTDGQTNAETMVSLTDPSNKLIYQMHQYLDIDGSGTHTECVDSTIGSTRLVAATEWLRANGKKGIIGEFAGAVDGVCEAAVEDMLTYLDANSDVWTGVLWWAAGPWWGTYMFSLEPNGGPAYETYLPILTAAQ